MNNRLEPSARNTDPQTSHDAAEKMRPRAEGLRGRIVLCLKVFGPQNCDEIADNIHAPLQSVTPRMKELVVRGMVRDTGRTRPGKWGAERIVWEAVWTA